MDLTKLNNNSYMINNSTNLGLYMFNDRDCLLVDTPYPGRPTKKLLNLLKDEKLNLKYIINTHGHIDHFGGNELLAENFSLDVYTSPYEKAFISHPELTHSFLTASKPIPDLATNLDGMDVKEIRNKSLKLDNTNFEIVELPGHSRGHIGVLTEDKILYAGDAMLAPSIIKQLKIPYFYDIDKFRDSLSKIKNLYQNNKMEVLVPSHGKPIDGNFEEAVDLNLKKVQSLLKLLLKILETKPLSLEKIIVEFNKKFNITEGIPNHFITRACIMSFLSYFIENNKVKTIFKDNLLHYQLNNRIN